VPEPSLASLGRVWGKGIGDGDNRTSFWGTVTSAGWVGRKGRRRTAGSVSALRVESRRGKANSRSEMISHLPQAWLALSHTPTI